jgi:hypothetical protein
VKEIDLNDLKGLDSRLRGWVEIGRTSLKKSQG